MDNTENYDRDMSCLPQEKRWDYKKTLRLIKLYKNFPELWDPTNPNYTNAYKKIKRIKDLAALLNVSAPEIKRKLKSLRSIYSRVHKKVLEVIEKDGVYTEKLWFAYRKMLFLSKDSENIEKKLKYNSNIKTESEIISNADNEADNSLSADNEESSKIKVSFRNSSFRSWNTKEIMLLITLYKRHPCLWNQQDKFHSDREKKHDAVKEIARTLNRNKNDILSKLKNLRSQFFRTHKKVSCSSDKEFAMRSLWFGYEPLKFLINGLDTEENNEIKQESIQDETENSLWSLSEEFQDNNNDDSNIQDPNYFEDPLQINMVNKPTASQPNISLKPQPCPDTVCNTSNTMDLDDYTVFGQFIGIELRKIKDEYELMKAKSQISNIIFEAQMRQIRKNNGITE